MYTRIHFVSPGTREKYSWVINTDRETIDHWQHNHPEAEDLIVTPLNDKEGLEALYWQKCLYHDIFFERSVCPEVRAKGRLELMEILELAGRLATGRASELWKRCMAFRFGSDPMASRQLIIPVTGWVSGKIRYGRIMIHEGRKISCDVECANAAEFKSEKAGANQAKSLANESRMAGARAVSAW